MTVRPATVSETPLIALTVLGFGIQIEAVSALDPLRADAACRRLRDMNAHSDVPGMIATLRELLPDLEQLAAYSTNDCLAAMRDLGVFLGSIKRHGTEPTEAVSEIVPVLLELGRRTHMIPRDTVHHYTTWNPTGERQRMYTGDPQEATLQESVRIVFPHLRDGVEICSVLTEFEPGHPMFAAFVDRLTDHLASMVEAIDVVISGVTPVFFARTLRPYFEEIVVDGSVYLGPAAAQVPLWLIDQAVWAADRGQPDYQEFIRDSVPYSLPRWRRYHDAWQRMPSVITRVVEAFDTADASPGLRATAEALTRMLRTVIVFRGRHLGLARQAYQKDVRLYSVGSGGAGIDLLRQIVDLTRENARLVALAAPKRRTTDRSTCEAKP